MPKSPVVEMPGGGARSARRPACEHRNLGAAMGFAAQGALPLWPNIGCAWMPPGP
jgi:hypothetical protein